MAVTNHPKTQAKVPPWAARGKLRLAHVPGGVSHAAQRVLLDAWGYAPAGLATACRYGPELADELAAKKFNAVCLTWSPGFSHEGDAAQWDAVRKLLPLLKKKKIKTIAQISLASCFGDELLRRVPQAARWLQRDAKGQPETFGDGRGFFMSAQNAEWRAYIGHKVQAALEAGFDGLFFDAVLCPPEEAEAFLAELRTRAATLRPEAPEDVLFYTHAQFFSGLHALSNLKFSGTGWRPELAGGELYSSLPALKLLFEEAGRDKAFCAGAHLGALSEAQRRLATAEIFAAGGSCHEFDAPAAYQAFYAEHPELFGPADPIGHTGVLVNDAAKHPDNIHACQALLSSWVRDSIQFDVIPISVLKDFDLRKYKVLSALHLTTLYSEVAERLGAFVREHHGALLVSSSTGTRDAQGVTRPQPEWFAHSFGTPRHERAVGGGRVISYGFSGADGQLGAGEFTRQVLPDVRQCGAPHPIEVAGPPGTVALLWGKGTRRWVHILNYGAQAADCVITLPGCGGRAMQVHSPDDPPPILAVTDAGHGNAAFSLANVGTYAVVEVI